MINDKSLLLVDVLKSLEKAEYKFGLEHLSQVKIFKLSHDQFFLASIQFKLLQIVPTSESSKDLKIKQVNEILTWDYSTHQKIIVVKHEPRRTLLAMSNQGKDNGVLMVEILWKVNEIRQITRFLGGARIFDLVIFKDTEENN